MRVGKHTDAFLSELVANSEGKTDCKFWYTDDWGGYERVLPPEVTHVIGKENTQRLERTNGIVRQQDRPMAQAAEQIWEVVGTD